MNYLETYLCPVAYGATEWILYRRRIDDDSRVENLGIFKTPSAISAAGKELAKKTGETFDCISPQRAAELGLKFGDI